MGFQKPETNVIFEQEYDKLTNRQDTVGIEQLLLTLAKQEGIEQGIEQGRPEKDILFVKNLLTSTTFSNEEIARLAGVDRDFVARLRAEIS